MSQAAEVATAMEVDDNDVNPDDPLLLKVKKRKDEQGPKKKKKKSRLNIQGASKPEGSLPELEPRNYQMEALEKALAQNTIVYLETGTGKTFIAIMFLKKLAHRLCNPEEKRIAVFLAPNVVLVNQQAAVLSSRTQFRVGVYYGQQMDTWDSQQWSKEVSSHEVLVMTPQVFYNALELSALSLNIVEVLMFDECHHAKKKHPYATIMKMYYHSPALKTKPRIFGMTGSLVSTKGSFVDSKCSQELSNLESILDSKIYTVTDRAELELKAPTPYHRNKFYSKPLTCFEELRASISRLREKYQQEQTMSASACRFSDEKETKRKLIKAISVLYNEVDLCLSDLGSLSASLALDIYLDNNSSQNQEMGPVVDDEDTLLADNYKMSYLKEVQNVLDNIAAEGHGHFASPAEVKLAVKEGLITPKVEALLVLLMKYKDVTNFRCIVFVERRIVSMVLPKLLKHFSCLDFVRADFMVGVNAENKKPTRYEEVMKSFQDGQLNLLISTSVAEEGLDVQTCNSVVRFDLCQTVRSHIQSRGRARKPGAEYIWLLERDNLEHQKLIDEMIKSEESIREEARSRMDKLVEISPVFDNELEVFQTRSGVYISTAGSIAFICKFCAKLPGDRYYNPKPEFSVVESDGLFTCVITFPPNAPFHVLEGSPRRSKQLAKSVACLEACKKLDALGVLKNENLNESSCGSAEFFASPDSKLSGSTKLKELFTSMRSTTLQGNWLTRTSGVCLNMYALTFWEEHHESNRYTSLAFLVEAALDADVGNIEVDLHATKNKVVKAKLCATGQCFLDPNQLVAAKAYQEVIFNGAYSRLVFREDERDRTLARCLLTYEQKAKDLWSQMYLLLPMSQGSIDWEVVFTTWEAAKLLPGLSTVLKRETTADAPEACIEVTDPGVIFMAAGPVRVTTLQDCVVLTIHTGKLFCITDILYELNAGSTFQGNKESEPCTYEEFYVRKHGRRLKYRKQPFLRAKPTHAVHNHLIRPCANKKHGSSDRELVEKFVELPPELCLVLDLKSSFVRTLYLVPSFMHRLTAYIIAGELRMKLTKHARFAHASKIVEALTSLRCQEGFSYEGLEMFGDSVLKYAVSRKLFLAYGDKHEGQLSGQRSQAICNATLRKLAVAHNLPAYIRDEPFYASLWLGAGMYRLRSRKCLCRPSNISTTGSSAPKFRNHNFYIGKTCGEGHRWMCSKTTSDVLEALIGAYAAGGGFDGALELMKALSIDVDFDSGLILSSQQCSEVPVKAVEDHSARLSYLEKELSYTFQNKGLLLQAITHASVPDSGFCYQRLEFLGDAALDFLITQHLFKTNPGLSPGLLSDLRAAAVNNDCFARVAVKYRLHTYLRHDSGELQAEITKFLKCLSQHSLGIEPTFGFKAISGPKVLADLVESIAGAVLVDSGFDLEKLWAVMKPMLSPLVTPATLPYHPIREFQELCTLKSFRPIWSLCSEDTGPSMSLIVEADECVYTAISQNTKKKDARKDAAVKMLATLKEHGHRHPRWESTDLNDTYLKQDVANQLDYIGFESMWEPSSLEVKTETPVHINVLTDVDMVIQVASEIKATQQVDSKEAQHPEAPLSEDPSPDYNSSQPGQVSVPSSEPSPLKVNRSSPSKCARTLLYELCTQRKWEKPKFTESEKLGVAHRPLFSMAVSLEVPDRGCVDKVSSPMPNKKRAMEDAAQKMLAHLNELGFPS